MGKKWIPLECNPEVFNTWANKAGLDSSSAQFYDVYGIDPELLSMIPRPVKAVILVFPYEEHRYKRQAEDERIAKEGKPNVDASVLWVKQTIGNACGTMALIHSLANTNATLVADSPLQIFIEKCKGKSPQECSQLLEDSQALEDVHVSVSTNGQSAIPPSDAHVDGAYTSFISAPAIASGEASVGRRVVELDGVRAGPVDRGECTDLLEDVARIVREDFLKDSSGSVKFSLMYLGQPM